MKKELYIAPEVEVVDVAVECGFSLSGFYDGDDYFFDGDGSEMD